MFIWAMLSSYWAPESLGSCIFLILSNRTVSPAESLPFYALFFCLSLLCYFRIRNPKAIHPHTHQHAMLDPASRRLPLRASLSDPHPLWSSHGAEPVAACPPHVFCPAATGPQPAPASHDHPPAHHGHVHHHRNHLIAGHGQPGRAQFHQRGQLGLVRG